MRTPLPLAALAVLGCGGPSLGELSTPIVTIAVSGIATDPAIATPGEPQGGLGIERAFVSMSALTVTPCRADATEIMLSARGYELLGDPPPEELISTAVTELCGLRFDIDPLEQNAAEGVPAGASLYVSGTNAAGSAFEVVSEQSFSLSFAVAASDAFGAEPIVLGFDLSSWLAALPMDVGYEYLTVEKLEKQLRGVVALYRDQDGNGALEGDELSPLATAATR